MKKLRVLTGRHAGAQLLLRSSAYRISADAQADIQISDWTLDPLVLTLQDDDVISMVFDNPAQAQVRPQARFKDFQPRRFGDVVLCTGPVRKAWPSDIVLLQKLMDGQQAVAVEKRKQGSVLPTACGLLALAVGSVLVSVMMRWNGSAQARTVPESLFSQVSRAVAPLDLKDIVISPEGQDVAIGGLLESVSDLSALRRALVHLPADRITNRYAVVTDITQGIADALAAPELSIGYRGQGRFVITGSTLNLAKVQEEAGRIAADLAPVVRAIEVDAASLPTPDRVPLDAMLSSDGLQYVQTRDGVKHLSFLHRPTEGLPRTSADLSQ